MPEYLTPGVYVEEVERGPTPISGVSTSTAGFLGETERGPTDPKLVTSFSDFKRRFGKPVENRYLSYGVEGFFRNGGQRCFVGRVTAETRVVSGVPGDEGRPRPDDLSASPDTLAFGSVPVGHTATRTVTLTNLGRPGEDDPIDVREEDAEITGDFEISGTIPDTVAPGDEEIDVTFTPSDTGTKRETLTVPYATDGGTNEVTVELEGAGEATEPGRLRASPTSHDFGTVIVGHTASATFALTNLGNSEEGHSSITVSNVEIEDGDDEFEVTEQPTSIDAGDSEDLTVEFTPEDVLAKRATMLVHHNGANSPITVRLERAGAVLAVNAAGPGRWGGRIAVIVEDGTLYKPGENQLFKLTVRYWSAEADATTARGYGADTERDEVPDADVEEVYDNLSPDEGSSEYYEKQINGVSNLIEVDRRAAGRPPRSAGDPTWLGASFPDADPQIALRNFQGDEDAPPGERTGLEAFKEIDEISIVCVPDEHAYSSIPPGGLTEAIVDHCEDNELRDRIAVLQARQSAGDIGELEPSRDSEYAAFYYPWIKVLDPETSAQKLVPPGGHVAGIYARSDTNRGVHKAPANEIVQGARELQFTITEREQGILNPKGVNVIRSFRGRGIRVWGARTTSSNALWRYVNVRRLFLYMEESIDEGTQWVVFEPNDEKLWARVRQSVSNFLTTVWQDGALMGTTADEAFYVRCDRTTMTQDQIDKGLLICEIGVAPVKPAEFVVFRISHWTGGAE